MVPSAFVKAARRMPKRAAPAKPAGSRWPLGRSPPALLLVVAGLAVYWNSLGAPFIWDDETAIVTNRTIRQIWPLTESLSRRSKHRWPAGRS